MDTADWLEDATITSCLNGLSIGGLADQIYLLSLLPKHMLAIALLFDTFLISLNGFFDLRRIRRHFLDIATVCIYLIKNVNFRCMIAETALSTFLRLKHILNKMKSFLFEFSIRTIHRIIKGVNHWSYLLILFVLQINIFSVHRF